MTRQEKKDEIKKRLEAAIVKMRATPDGKPDYHSDEYGDYISLTTEYGRFKDESKELHEEMWERVMDLPYFEK